jgi:hypothetical protein
MPRFGQLLSSTGLVQQIMQIEEFLRFFADTSPGRAVGMSPAEYAAQTGNDGLDSLRRGK